MTQLKHLVVINVLLVLVQCQSVDKTIVGLQNDLAIKLFRELSCCDVNVTCNVLFSPLSFHTTIGMFLLGAASSTAAREILSLYRYKSMYSENNIAEETRMITAAIRNNNRQFNPGIDISVTNKIFISDSFANRLRPSFQMELLNFFNASTQLFDFNSYETVHKLNNWMERERRGWITKYFEERLPNNIKMLLINQIFLQADWHFRFEMYNTRRDVFYNKGTEPVLVYYLQQRKFFHFGRSRTLDSSLLELPYYGLLLYLCL